MICEVGGTIGDIESLPFIEAIRQFEAEIGPKNSIFIHVSYVPFIGSAGEFKTKPTQHSVKEALSQGIQPDILLLRSEMPVPDEIKHKISLFCNVPKTSAVINCMMLIPSMKSLYCCTKKVSMKSLSSILIFGPENLIFSQWHRVVDRFKHPTCRSNIAVVGKYVDLIESYKSINEALIHAGIAHQSRVKCLI